MVNAWIEHVKQYSKDKGIKYSEAIKDPQCKSSYKPTKAIKAKLPLVKGGSKQSGMVAALIKEKDTVEPYQPFKLTKVLNPSQDLKDTYGKKTKKQKKSAWVDHVKDCAKKKGISYSQAMKDPDCKATYEKKKSKKIKGKSVKGEGVKDDIYNFFSKKETRVVPVQEEVDANDEQQLEEEIETPIDLNPNPIYQNNTNQIVPLESETVEDEMVIPEFNPLYYNKRDLNEYTQKMVQKLVNKKLRTLRFYKAEASNYDIDKKLAEQNKYIYIEPEFTVEQELDRMIKGSERANKYLEAPYELKFKAMKRYLKRKISNIEKYGTKYERNKAYWENPQDHDFYPDDFTGLDVTSGSDIEGEGIWEQLYDLISPPVDYEEWRDRQSERILTQAEKDKIKKEYAARQKMIEAERELREAQKEYETRKGASKQYGKFEGDVERPIDWEKAKKDYEREQDEAWEMVNGKGVKEFVSPTAWKDYGTAIIKGRTDLPPHVREILKKYGDKTIARIYTCRTPVRQILLEALNVVSWGEFFNRFGKTPYDKLFHLDLRVELNTSPPVTVLLEKNEVIMAKVNPAPPVKETECQLISNVKPIKLTELIEGAKRIQGDRFLKYSAYNNNCQDFVMALLRGSNMGTQENYDFIKQDTKELFKGLPGLRKFANTVTDIGAVINTTIEGAGSGQSSANLEERNERKREIINSIIDILKTARNKNEYGHMELRIQDEIMNLRDDRELRLQHPKYDILTSKDLTDILIAIDDYYLQNMNEIESRFDVEIPRARRMDRTEREFSRNEPIVQAEPIEIPMAEAKVEESAKKESSAKGLGIQKSDNYYVQSIVFEKSKFDVKQARKWLKDNNYVSRAPDVTDTQIRWRQVNPKYIEKKGFDKFRTKKIGKNSGISFIIAYKKPIKGGIIGDPDPPQGNEIAPLFTPVSVIIRNSVETLNEIREHLTPDEIGLVQKEINGLRQFVNRDPQTLTPAERVTIEMADAYISALSNSIYDKLYSEGTGINKKHIKGKSVEKNESSANKRNNLTRNEAEQRVPNVDEDMFEIGRQFISDDDRNRILAWQINIEGLADTSNNDRLLEIASEIQDELDGDQIEYDKIMNLIHEASMIRDSILQNNSNIPYRIVKNPYAK